MYPSGQVETTQRGTWPEPEPDAADRDRVAPLLGVGSCSVVLLLGLALYLAEFQVDRRLVNGTLALLVLAAAVVFYGSRPESRLTPGERLVRSRRVAHAFVGLLTGAAVLGAIASAAELDSVRDWVMLAIIAASPIGAHFLVYVRFGIR